MVVGKGTSARVAETLHVHKTIEVAAVMIPQRRTRAIVLIRLIPKFRASAVAGAGASAFVTA